MLNLTYRFTASSVMNHDHTQHEVEKLKSPGLGSDIPVQHRKSHPPQFA